jgi:PAS domain S-box-containing protein
MGVDGRSAEDDSDRTTIRSDAHGVLRHWGADMEGLLGHTAEQAVGQSIGLIIPTPLHAWHWRGFDKAITTGVMHKPDATVRVPALHRDGRFVPVKGEIGLVRNADGGIAGAQVTHVRPDSPWLSAVWRPAVAVIGLAGRVGLRPRKAKSGAD